jgi:hypothetical protein
MPQFVRFPVQTREDFRKFWKERMRPDLNERIGPDWREKLRRHRNRDYVFVVLADRWGSLFGGPRNHVGVERLCTLFYDDPAFLEEMLVFWADYLARLMRNLFSQFVPDEVYISEDMAYKRFAMISPEMVKRYLLPIWRRWADLVYGAGVRIYSMDSDGFVGELIPLWIEAGFNVCDPIEVAAENDIVALRRRFGRNMAFRGGVDKREIAAGGRHIEQEIERLGPVVESGGFIPSCDHGVPSDVSWPAFVEYTGSLAGRLGWL